MSAAMSSPLLIFAKLDVRQNILPDTVNSFCYVDWENGTNKLIYTIICFSVQYLIPSISVGILYTGISSTITQPASTDLSSNIFSRKMARRKKTNMILMMVSLVFFT